VKGNTMTEEVTGPAPMLKRMAAARAARTRVDANGKPTGEPAVFTYDEKGILIAAKPAPDSPAGRAIASPEAS
jgi:hypothetical protein